MHVMLKITSMANMKDAERLELLKEIGGVKVYEERRKETAKIMNETSGNRIQIEDMVMDISLQFMVIKFALDQEH